MSYQVFARKYRPQTFDDVVGQEQITRTLKNAILQLRLAHAYLFVGPRGTGKTSTARIFAKCLRCVQAPTIEPCGVCDACREIAGGNSLDVLEIDGASNNGVDQVRELREAVRYTPAQGKYKLYIIDEVHMLSTSAFNALLKTLEEPPEHVIFIFATTEPQKVLPTILSRCQRFDLRRIPAPLIAAHLQKIAGLEKIELAPDAAEAIARGAEGGLRDAESMLDQLVAFCGNRIALDDVLGIFGFTAPETVARMVGHLLQADTPGVLELLDAQSEAGKDLLRLLGELISHLRNLLVFQVNPGSAKEEIGESMLRSYETQAAAVSPDRLLELIDQFAEAEHRMKPAPNKKLAFEIALIKAVQSLGQATLTEVIDALTALREGDPAPGPGLASSGARPGQALSSASAGSPSGAGGSSSPFADRRAGRSDAPTAGAGGGGHSIAAVTGEKPKMDWGSLRKAVAKPAPVEAEAPPAPRVAEAEPSAAPTPSAAKPAPTAAKPAAQTPPPASKSASSAAPDAAVATADPPDTAPGKPSVASAAPLDGPRLWADLAGELRSERPLIKGWVPYGRVLSTANDTVLVGFPTAQRMIFESLGKPNNRKLLESLLTKLAGRPVTLKMELRDEDEPDAAAAPAKPAAPPTPAARARPPAADDDADYPAAPDTDDYPLGDGEEPASPVTAHAAAASAPARGHANGARVATAAAARMSGSTPAADDTTETFKNDPLIQKALKIFEGEIRLVEGPDAK